MYVYGELVMSRYRRGQERGSSATAMNRVLSLILLVALFLVIFCEGARTQYVHLSLHI